MASHVGPLFGVHRTVGSRGRHASARQIDFDPLGKSIVRCSRRKGALREGTVVGSGQFGEGLPDITFSAGRDNDKQAVIAGP